MNYQSSLNRVLTDEKRSWQDNLNFMCWCPFKPALIFGVSLRHFGSMRENSEKNNPLQEAQLVAFSLESSEPELVFVTFLPMDISHGKMVAIHHHHTLPRIACLFERAAYVWDYELSSIVGRRHFSRNITAGGFFPNKERLWLLQTYVWAEWDYYETGILHEYPLENGEYAGRAILHSSGELIGVVCQDNISGYSIHRNCNRRSLNYFEEPAVEGVDLHVPIFSPSGDRIAFTSSIFDVDQDTYLPHVLIYDLKTANLILKFSVNTSSKSIHSFQFGEGGSTITLRHDNRIGIYNAYTGQCLFEHNPHSEILNYNANADNGMYVISHSTGWLTVIKNDEFNSTFSSSQLFNQSYQLAEDFIADNQRHIRTVNE